MRRLRFAELIFVRQWARGDWLRLPEGDRITALIETWLGEGLCREAVVNLKLPVKQRHAELRRRRERIGSGLQARGRQVSLACKRLYCHDREEVTCHLRRLGSRSPGRGLFGDNGRPSPQE